MHDHHDEQREQMDIDRTGKTPEEAKKGSIFGILRRLRMYVESDAGAALTHPEVARLCELLGYVPGESGDLDGDVEPDDSDHGDRWKTGPFEPGVN